MQPTIGPKKSIVSISYLRSDRNGKKGYRVGMRGEAQGQSMADQLWSS